MSNLPPADPSSNEPASDTYELPPKRSGRARNVITVVLVLAAVAILFYQRMGGFQGPTKPDHIAWSTDFQKALAESKATGKPVLVDFSASWCMPCEQMKKKSWPDDKVQQIVKDKYIPVFMNVEDQASNEVAHKYVVEYLPLVLILDSDGKVLKKHDSYMDASELADFLSGAASVNQPALPQASAR